jgi:hypothetical protein
MPTTSSANRAAYAACSLAASKEKGASRPSIFARKNRKSRKNTRKNRKNRRSTRRN